MLLKKLYDQYGLKEESQVLFVGVNIGGVLAKVTGVRKHHRGIKFLSLPTGDDEFIYRYEFQEKDMHYITKVYDTGGLFGKAEDGGGENFAIPGPFDLLDRDAVYRSFCNLAEMCGHAQFSVYCEAVIGAEKVRSILSYFGLSENSRHDRIPTWPQKHKRTGFEH